MFAPVVKTVPVLKTKLPPVLPPPAKEPMPKLLLSCNIAPLMLLRLTAELLPNALACVVTTLPLLTLVLPVYALFPLSVSVPPAALTDKPPEPVMRPDKVAEIAFKLNDALPTLAKVCSV